jgi:hypothetical protein
VAPPAPLASIRNLYTLSEHVAPPLTYSHVLRYLKQELAALVLVKPAAAT